MLQQCYTESKDSDKVADRSLSMGFHVWTQLQNNSSSKKNNNGVYLTNRGNKESLRLQVDSCLTPDHVHNVQKSQGKATNARWYGSINEGLKLVVYQQAVDSIQITGAAGGAKGRAT